MYKILLKYFFILCVTIANEKYVGIIKGQIFNSENQLPLAGANIYIEETDLGSISDEEGYFLIENIPQNYYNLSISFIGYESKTIPDIWVRPRANDFLKITLNPKILNFKSITVENSFFSKSTLNEHSSVAFNNDEIRRAPGAGQEISRILNSLPSVASVGENRQDMMVRGGGPTENGFIIDNIPIPSISHFNTSDGRSNGPIGIINTEMVDNLEFYANGFSSKFGNKLSSYGDIDYREGSNNTFEFNFGLGLGGLSSLIEGPITQNISYILSYRKSYLNIISDLINAGGLPSYDDLQGKVTYKPNIYNTFTLLTVNGGSLYNRSVEEGISIGMGVHGKVKNNQNTIGLNHKHIWNKKTYSNTSFGFSFQNANTKLYDIVDGVGTDTLSFKNQNKIQTITFRNVNHQKISNFHNLEYGFESLKNCTDYNFIRGRDSEFNVNEEIYVLNLASYLSIKSKILNQIILSSGVRLDFNDYEKSIFLSPRINIDYRIFDKTNLIFNIGNYYQNPPEIYLSVNKNDLTSVRNIQQSLTLEHIFFKDTKFSLSIYNKDYSNAPILKPDSSYIDPTFLMDQLIMYDGIVSRGEANSKGLEILLQKKRVEKFYGLIGGSYFNSLFKDFNGYEWNRNYNYKYILNIVGGYRPNDQWEISVRWSLFGGKPYTRINEAASSLFGKQVLYLDDFNGEKTPEYHSLFIRYERRFNLKRSNLITYIELWNAYNRENIETVLWSEELNQITKETYFDFIPVGGLELEF